MLANPRGWQRWVGERKARGPETFRSDSNRAGHIVKPQQRTKPRDVVEALLAR